MTKILFAATQQTTKRPNFCLLQRSKQQNDQIPVCCNAANHKTAILLSAAMQQSIFLFLPAALQQTKIFFTFAAI
jgi:hypothetical protein